MTKLRVYILTAAGMATALMLSGCAGATMPLDTGKPASSSVPVVFWEAPAVETVNVELPAAGQRMGVHKSVETYWTLEQAVTMSFHYGPGGCHGD